MVLALKKIWAWIKSYWYVPLVLIGSFILIYNTKDFDFDKILQKGRESHKKEIEKIKKTEERKRQRKAEIEKKKEKRLIQVEAEIIKNREALDKEKRKKVKKIVNKYHENPEKIAKMLSKKYGYDIVLPRD